MRKIVVIGIIVVLAATLAAGCRRSPWNDGEFRGEGQGYKSTIAVNVTVAKGKITAVVVTEQAETPAVAEPAIAEIPNRIIQKQSTQVEVVSGATKTSQGIIAAVNSALEKARKQ